MMQQLAFNFGNQPSFLEEDFIVSENNQLAWEWITRWPDWPSYGLILYGPPGCGKTHLGHIWAQYAKACIIHELNQIDFLSVKTPVLLDISKNIQDNPIPHNLFHLLNHCANNNFSILITSHITPSSWPIDLPDIRSRLHALPQVAIGAYGHQTFAVIQKWLTENHFTCSSPKVIDILIEVYVAEPDFLHFLAIQQRARRSLSPAIIRECLHLYYEKKEKNQPCSQL